MNLYPHLQPQPDDLAYFAAGHCDDGVKQRIVFERAIVRRACTDLLAAGLTISVFDGDATTLKRSTNLADIMEAIQTTDEDQLLVGTSEGKRIGMISLIYGNDGHDVMADYTLTLEDHLKGANALADELAQ